jgi:lysine biosynthesis protein LysW
MKADCPSCDAQVNVGSKPRMGQFITCPNCRTKLEITWLDPVELDWPYDEDDYDDFDDDYDD